jgi:hypothetical protein
MKNTKDASVKRYPSFLAAWLLMTTSFCAAGLAQQPDFSGVWKLNETESSLDEAYSFAPLEVTITQGGNEMTTSRVSEYQGNRIRRSSTYILDGTHRHSDPFQGTEIIAVGSWIENGQALKIVTSFEKMDGGPLIITTVYRFNGEQLAISNAVEGGPEKRVPETWVFDRQ